MAKISEFLSALKGGGARPNRFNILVNFPAFAGGADEIRQTSFLVQSTSLPGSNLGVIEVPYKGRQIKIAGDRTFDEWEATFLVDVDFGLRNAFEAWQNGINAYNSNTGTNVPDDYFATVEVNQLDSQDNVIKSYTLRYAWPQVVAPVELAQDNNDALENFSVTFAYSDLEHSNAT